MTLRLAALLGLGTLGVHQLRYLVGYQGHADAALASNGHAYLTSLLPAMAGVALLTLAGLIQQAADAAESRGPRFRRLWAGSTAGLIAVYSAQELVEGAPLVAHGGWVAVPVAVAVGLAIAIVMRGAAAAGELGAPRRPWHPPAALVPTDLALATASAAPHATIPRVSLARGPPAVSV